MSPRKLSRLTRPSALRTRAGVLAAGLGVSLAAGTGAAFAATGGAAPAAPAVATAAVQHQAAVQTSAQTSVPAKAKANAVPSWIDPVSQYTLSAGFGRAGNMWSAKHSGQDFAVPIGTAVHAVHGGTVVKAGSSGAGDGPAYGNAIVIKHGDGTYSQYAHLSKIQVHVGQYVKTGQQIALSGNTGNSSGPHLHFEIRTTPNYGSAVNPVNFLRSVGVKV
ncbi:M23 family metallopeptidase [Streptomyces sp. GMY02]|uniref:M23 family metallopeptidase n=1 Tax=Streptomyces sp. GMY02 TaxID=1333528 RepID=UPI001C2C9C3D|nr:M23 family metallopeptidase [Streptomyces sp. GMY02]QXE35363.1 M23 family metallopeptidase [Streptomyces sp. GMY02]